MVKKSSILNLFQGGTHLRFPIHIKNIMLLVTIHLSLMYILCSTKFVVFQKTFFIHFHKMIYAKNVRILIDKINNLCRVSFKEYSYQIRGQSSVFIISRKSANFAVYCSIFSSYYISDKKRSVLFRDQLYVFWDCLYSGSVFDSMCFSPFFRFEMGNQSLLDLDHFRDLTLVSFRC